MDAKKIQSYAHNIISSTWPKYKRHMGERDYENIKKVEEILQKFHTELLNEFVEKHGSNQSTIQEPAINISKKKSKKEDSNELYVVTFKTNLKAKKPIEFQIWRRGSEQRITNYEIKNDPSRDVSEWTENVFQVQAILKYGNKDIVLEKLKEYYPDVEFIGSELVTLEQINSALSIFPDFKNLTTF